jgi:thymidylate synthase
MAYADQLFLANCREILEQGVWDKGAAVRPRWQDDNSPAYTIKRFALVNRYDLSREFPILTLRQINFAAAVDEIFWIWQKKSNNVQELASHIWDPWADEKGSIGKAYGYQLGVKHRFPEGEMDQVDMLLHNLRHSPHSRRMVSNIFVHSDLAEMNLYPCAYSLTLNVSGDRLNAILHQRSQDMLVANNWNVVQYAVLLHMFARYAGLQAGELVHVIADAHIYDRHIPLIENLFEREPFAAPSLIIDDKIQDFYAFSVGSFSLQNYQHHGSVGRIPVAV